MVEQFVINAKELIGFSDVCEKQGSDSRRTSRNDTKRNKKDSDQKVDSAHDPERGDETSTSKFYKKRKEFDSTHIDFSKDEGFMLLGDTKKTETSIFLPAKADTAEFNIPEEEADTPELRQEFAKRRIIFARNK